MRYKNVLLLVVSLLSLSACALITAPLLEPQVIKTLTTFPGPPLSPAYSGNPACPNISGRYRDKSVSLLRQFPEVRNRNKVAVEETVIRGELRRAKAPVVHSFYYHDTLEFYQQAILGVEQKDRTLTITLMDNDSVAYKRVTIGLDHSLIGCRDGMLVVRNGDFIGGAEGSLGIAYSEENQWRKLPDGNLEVKVEKREWYYSYYLGLRGFGPDNRASGTEPQKRRWKAIFPAVE